MIGPYKILIGPVNLLFLFTYTNLQLFWIYWKFCSPHLKLVAKNPKRKAKATMPRDIWKSPVFFEKIPFFRISAKCWQKSFIFYLNNLRIPNNRSPQLKLVAKNPKGKAPMPKDIWKPPVLNMLPNWPPLAPPADSGSGLCPLGLLKN